MLNERWERVRMEGVKDQVAIAAKEDKSKKSKSKPKEPSTAEPAS